MLESILGNKLGAGMSPNKIMIFFSSKLKSENLTLWHCCTRKQSMEVHGLKMHKKGISVNPPNEVYQLSTLYRRPSRRRLEHCTVTCSIMGSSPTNCGYGSKYMDQKSLAAMLVTKRPAGVTLGVNLKNPLHADEKARDPTWLWNGGGQYHQKTKTGVSVAPQERLMSPINFFKTRMWKRHYVVILTPVRARMMISVSFNVTQYVYLCICVYLYRFCDGCLLPLFWFIVLYCMKLHNRSFGILCK